MPSKSILPRGFKAEAERISERYRSELGLSTFAPLDAFELAKHLGIQIFTVDEIFDDKSHPSYLTMRETSRFNAMWTPNFNGDKIIIHNDAHSRFRQQSNIMHELSHIIRKHTVPTESAQLCAQLGLHYFNPLHEQEAKYLGGCLQITRPGLLRAIKYNYTAEKMSEYYGASVEMVNYRLGVTGALKQSHSWH